MNVNLITKNELKPALWDGGSTYEYFIFPPYSNYNERNFIFRFSHATIKKTPSNFTKFESYLRYLVMLDNELRISKNNILENYSPFEVFSFDSNDDIISFSQGNDFNLMISKEVINSDVKIIFEKGNSNQPWILFFAVFKTKLIIQNQEYELSPLDCIVIENKNKQEINYSFNNKLIQATFSIEE